MPPVMRMKKTASTQVIKASVSSQPTMSCQPGRLKRKKFSGLPKTGSRKPPAAGAAYQKSAIVGHSSITPAPVATAMTSERPTAMRRRTGSTGSFSGCPPMKIVRPLGRSGRCVRFRTRNDPYRMRNVAAAKAVKIPHWRPSVFQNTSR